MGNIPPAVQVLDVPTLLGLFKSVLKILLNLRDLFEVIGYLETLHIYINKV